MTMKLIDITHPMNDALACWPGDTPYRFRLAWEMAQGATVNVGSITTSVHSGTHADAPFHFRADGATIDRLDLGAYIGEAIVIDVRGREAIHIDDVSSKGTMAPRVLFKTGCWDDITRFPDRITVMAPGLPTFLRNQGVKLVGLDVPSVDALDSTDLPIHHELDRCGIRILEGLNLRDVQAGNYELIALPTKLAGADGAPVRAVLRTMS
jgi:arylformamidase